MSSDSLDKDFCLQKVDSAISMVERLIDGDYPHPDSKQALSRIIDVYRADRDLLLSMRWRRELGGGARHADDGGRWRRELGGGARQPSGFNNCGEGAAAQDTVLEHCRRVNINLVRFKAFLGLLLRSSNIRNAFELYFPIKILSLELLEQRTAVVLSSEWNFSPFTYPVALPELPEFIFIGIPASESQNPLILPLAGHELGHVVWRRKGAKTEFDPIIRAEIIRLYKEKDKWTRFIKIFAQSPTSPDKLETDLFSRGIWGQSYKLAQRQLEEVFCDYVGLYIFGQSFLHSFRYLIAPSLGYHRTANYPRLRERAEYMIRYGTDLKLPEITGYANSFSEQDYNLSPSEAFILEVADEATKNFHTQLPAIVDKYRGRAEPFSTGIGDEPGVKQSLLNLVPAASAKSMTAVVNAAWEIRLEIDSWDILSDIDDEDKRKKEKLRILKDLVLKSFEVYEFRKRVEKYKAGTGKDNAS